MNWKLDTREMKSLWKSQIGWKIKKRCQISGWLRDGAKSNARTRRERTAMSLEGILASCMKAEKIASESQRKYSWERRPDSEKGNEDGV